MNDSRTPRGMARNVELKARVDGLAALRPAVAAVANEGPHTLLQDDTYFGCPSGRLKLRTQGDGNGELIYYRRDDEAGARESHYLCTPVSEPELLRTQLALAYGITARVRKERTLYRRGRTRIHHDRVEGLGEFIELEVVLADEESPATGVAEAQALLARLGLAGVELVARGYADLSGAPTPKPG